MKLHDAEHILETDEKQFISKALKDLIGKCDTGGSGEDYIETFEQLKEVANLSSSQRIKFLNLKPGCYIKMTEPLTFRFADSGVFNGNGATIETTGLHWGMHAICGENCEIKNIIVLDKDSGSYYVGGPELKDFAGIKTAFHVNIGVNGKLSNCIFKCTGKLGLNVWSGISYSVSNCKFLSTRVAFCGIGGNITNNYFVYGAVLTHCGLSNGGINMSYTNNTFSFTQILLINGTGLTFSHNRIESSDIFTLKAPYYDSDSLTFSKTYHGGGAMLSLNFSNNTLSACMMKIDPNCIGSRAIIKNNINTEDTTGDVIIIAKMPYVDRFLHYGEMKAISNNPTIHYGDTNDPMKDKNNKILIDGNHGMMVQLEDLQCARSIIIKNSEVMIPQSKKKIIKNMGFTTYPNDINYPLDSGFDIFAFRFLTHEISDKIIGEASYMSSIYIEMKHANDVLLFSIYGGPNAKYDRVYIYEEQKYVVKAKNCTRYDFEIPYTESTLPELNSITPTQTEIGDEYVDMNHVSDPDYKYKSGVSELETINKEIVDYTEIYNYLECDDCRISLYDTLANPEHDPYYVPKPDPENKLERSLFFKELIIKDSVIKGYQHKRSPINDGNLLRQPLYIDLYNENTKCIISNVELLSNCNLLRLNLNKAENNLMFVNNITNYSDELIENIITMPEGKTIINPIEINN